MIEAQLGRWRAADMRLIGATHNSGCRRAVRENCVDIFKSNGPCVGHAANGLEQLPEVAQV